jgi:hypothetical protein
VTYFAPFICVTRAAHTGHFTLLNHLTNIALKWALMFLTYIREALSSHLGRNIGYSERAFRNFTHFCKESAGIVPKPTTTASFDSHPILRNPVTLLVESVIWDTITAIKTHTHTHIYILTSLLKHRERKYVTYNCAHSHLKLRQLQAKEPCFLPHQARLCHPSRPSVYTSKLTQATENPSKQNVTHRLDSVPPWWHIIKAHVLQEIKGRN